MQKKLEKKPIESTPSPKVEYMRSKGLLVGVISEIFFTRQKQQYELIIQSNIHIYTNNPYNTHNTAKMSQHHHKTTSNNLHAIFGRSEIVQKYPPNPHYNHQIFLEQQLLQPKQNDFFDSLMRQHEIVEEYADHDLGSTRRSILNCDNLMASESDNNQVPSRNSSLSSKQNNLDFHNRSFDRLPFITKKYSEEGMDIQLPTENKRPSVNYVLPKTPVRLDVEARDREKTEKINKIQQVGCNCRKSKCLKMYCECFHLQIFCSQNCNCIDCGNAEPTKGHQQAVIDALTRNPKAFQQQKPTTQNAFTLGVQLAQVKKGCKCKKTKCLKKYCECFNSGTKCGIFCKCENCQNGTNENNNN